MSLVERIIVGAALHAAQRLSWRSVSIGLTPAQRHALAIFLLTVPPLDVEAA